MNQISAGQLFLQAMAIFSPFFVLLAIPAFLYWITLRHDPFFVPSFRFREFSHRLIKRIHARVFPQHFLECLVRRAVDEFEIIERAQFTQLFRGLSIAVANGPDECVAEILAGVFDRRRHRQPMLAHHVYNYPQAVDHVIFECGWDGATADLGRCEEAITKRVVYIIKFELVNFAADIPVDVRMRFYSHGEELVRPRLRYAFIRSDDGENVGDRGHENG